MKKPKYRNGQEEGAKLEDSQCELLDAADIDYVRERLAHSKHTAERSEGKCDLIINKEYFIELKSVGKNKMGYKLNVNGPKKGIIIKAHQLAFLYRQWYTHGKEAGLLLEFRPLKPIYIRIEDFYRFAMNSEAKSITYYDACIIGREVDSILDVVRKCA